MKFDLNVENYTRDELIEMFELPSNFDRNIIEIKEAKLKDSIINNIEIEKETKTNTLNFLVQAKNIILNGLQPGKTSLQKKIEYFYNSSYELKTSKLEDPQEHMVQVRPEKPYLSSFPSEFFPGVINPLKKRTIKKNLNIDSRFRENYYTSAASNFNIILPIDMNNVVQMQLAAIELPTTYYAISKQYGNNFLMHGLFIVGLPHESVESVTDTYNKIMSQEIPLHSTYFESLHIMKPGMTWLQSEFDKNWHNYGYTEISKTDTPFLNWKNIDPIWYRKISIFGNSARKAVLGGKHKKTRRRHRKTRR